MASDSLHERQGDLRTYLSVFFDTTWGTRKKQKVMLKCGVHKLSDVLFVKYVFLEAVAAFAAGLVVIIYVRPGNGSCPRTMDLIQSSLFRRYVGDMPKRVFHQEVAGQTFYKYVLLKEAALWVAFKPNVFQFNDGSVYPMLAENIGNYLLHQVFLKMRRAMKKKNHLKNKKKTISNVAYDSSIPEHQQALRVLWRAAFPEEELHGLISEQWKEMGWQGKDPSTDFR
ncbi:hypothetical protein L2E82_02148 [Cichorium intybus]|uniref:Uncharacterized protein n=1 Tax=Cichorium intybus TaxID=13427 RepID=A0ACB9H1Y1_CICIN|nr:hypothetical protein L2E82_02148 [Cichorium intybus]